MAITDYNGESEFPFSKELVFDAICKIIPSIKGMKIESADKLQGRIVVKSGTSLFSWGENISIQLISNNENRTSVKITSSPKTGIMFGGMFDFGKNRKNIEAILSRTSRFLSYDTTNQTEENHLTTNIQNYTEKHWYDKTWLVILLCWIFFPVGIYGLWKSNKIPIGWKIFVSIFVFICFMDFVSDGRFSNSNSNNNYAEDTIKIDAILYYRAYHQNEIKADDLYKGKTIRIWGYVSEIKKDVFDNPYVEFKIDYYGFESVTIRLKNSDDARTIRIGQKVVFVGNGDGMSIGTPSISEAKLVRIVN